MRGSVRLGGRELVGRLGLDAALDIVAAAARVLAPAGKVGTVGYCWGGTVAWVAAARGVFGATASANSMFAA